MRERPPPSPSLRSGPSHAGDAGRLRFAGDETFGLSTRLCKIPIKNALPQQRHLPAIRNPKSAIRKSKLTLSIKLTNDTEKPRPKDRGNPIVTVTIHRRRDCGLNMQGRSCRIPEVADQCHVVWELCNSGISCLSTGVFVFDFFLRAMSFEEINWIHPSARFDRYCTFRFVRNFTRALSRCSDYIVQK